MNASTSTGEIPSLASIESFIRRWKGSGGSEIGNAQPFISQLCTDVLGVEPPEPASARVEKNTYVFERRVTFTNGRERSTGRIDCYKRGHFVLEAKQGTGAPVETEGEALGVERLTRKKETARRGTRAWQRAMKRAKEQAHRYARALPAEEEWPPFLVVVDVGYCIDLYADFSRQGKAYTPFPDQKRFRTRLLEKVRSRLEAFPKALENLWATMDRGDYEAGLMVDVRRFNGRLFSEAEALEISAPQLDLLVEAARADWSDVEPAIFGTLLERALDPRERHRLGAHYTPRAYVERLVTPTVVEPLRDEWNAAQTAAAALDEAGKPEEAAEEIQKFHRRLCTVKVLDPACGSGNFLYVTLEHLKRLEAEALDVLHGYEVQATLDMTGGYRVTPEQLMGLEVNPRAAAITEVVLWIGYLQ